MAPSLTVAVATELWCATCGCTFTSALARAGESRTPGAALKVPCIIIPLALPVFSAVLAVHDAADRAVLEAPGADTCGAGGGEEGPKT